MKILMYNTMDLQEEIRRQQEAQTDIIKKSLAPTIGEMVEDIKKAKASPIGTISTHGGVKVQRVATGWVPVKNDINKPKTAEDETESKQTVPDLAEHAKTASAEALQNAVKNSKDPEIRNAAHREMQRRKTEEEQEMLTKPEGGEGGQKPSTEEKPKAAEGAEEKPKKSFAELKKEHIAKTAAASEETQKFLEGAQVDYMTDERADISSPRGKFSLYADGKGGWFRMNGDKYPDPSTLKGGKDDSEESPNKKAERDSDEYRKSDEGKAEHKARQEEADAKSKDRAEKQKKQDEEDKWVEAMKKEAEPKVEHYKSLGGAGRKKYMETLKNEWIPETEKMLKEAKSDALKDILKKQSTFEKEILLPSIEAAQKEIEKELDDKHPLPF